MLLYYRAERYFIIFDFAKNLFLTILEGKKDIYLQNCEYLQ